MAELDGVEAIDIASWLGHFSINTTLRFYAHLFPIRKDNVANIINKGFRIGKKCAFFYLLIQF